MDRRRGYKFLDQLRLGEEVEIPNDDDTGSGIFVKMIPGDLTVGDTYIGARNTINLLTVRQFHLGCVYPVEVGYPFNLNECIKIEVVRC